MCPSPVTKFACFLLTCLLAWPVAAHHPRVPKVQVEHFSVEQGLANQDARDIVQK